MSVSRFSSCLAAQMDRFINLRRLSGTDYHSQTRLLECFDRFLTQQSFNRPPITREITDSYQQSLTRLAPRDLRASEYSHHREHTIEFQAVFLALSQPEATIVPLLCSFSLEDLESDKDYIHEMAKLLCDLAGSQGRQVGFIASVDLAHIGPRYGDNFRPHEGTLAQHLRADSDLLAALEECDARQFIGILRGERNERRICGLAPLYVLARIFEGSAEGRLLHHSHVTVDQNDSFVTFASMAFYRKA